MIAWQGQEGSREFVVAKQLISILCQPKDISIRECDMIMLADELHVLTVSGHRSEPQAGTRLGRHLGLQ